MKPRPFVPVAPPPSSAAVPLSGQKRPATDEAGTVAMSPPAKERKVQEGNDVNKTGEKEEIMKTPENKDKTPTSPARSGEPKQRRTTRKRKVIA